MAHEVASQFGQLSVMAKRLPRAKMDMPTAPKTHTHKQPERCCWTNASPELTHIGEDC